MISHLNAFALNILFKINSSVKDSYVERKASKLPSEVVAVEAAAVEEEVVVGVAAVEEEEVEVVVVVGEVVVVLQLHMGDLMKEKSDLNILQIKTA